MEKFSKGVGKKAGMTAKPKHFVVEKESGRSRIAESTETPAAYATRIKKEAVRKAKRFHVEFR